MEEYLNSLLRTSRLIWWGVILQASLFAVWGVNLFITAKTSSQEKWPYFVFSALGLMSLIYGIKFFQNFSSIRKTEILKQEPKKRKETLLLITVIHFLLLEFVCILGILLAVFLQYKEAVYPFFAVSMIGLAFSFPTKDWFVAYFSETTEA